MEYRDVKTVGDLCDYISLCKGSIFAREQKGKKWGSFSLIELPSDKAIDHSLRFVKEGLIPTRIKQKGE